MKFISVLAACSLALSCSSQVTSSVPPATDAGPSVATGVPCEVADLLAQNCLSCHGNRLAEGTTLHLLTREQILAPSASDPTRSNLQLMIARMRDTNRATAMPPNSQLPDAEIAPFEAWLAAGAAGAACDRDASTPPVDAAAYPPGGDLPCEVQALLTAECSSCHGATPTNDAGVPLVTLSDLRADSPSVPGMTLAQRAVTRMRATASTMPPSGALPAERVQPFADWVAAGAPGTVCEAPPVDPFSLPEQCTSNRRWTGGNRESPAMNPGQACISCHSTMRGPRYAFAGTVYATGHEPNNCNGATGNASETVLVEIRGANGTTITLAPNAVGNFYTRSALQLPYTARVIVGDRERRMNTPQTNGDCNTCHSAAGAEGAPGRIALP
ncbi:MAG: hypothetical protein R3A52_16155 [Polyangiales bacterium]